MQANRGGRRPLLREQLRVSGMSYREYEIPFEWHDCADGQPALAGRLLIEVTLQRPYSHWMLFRQVYQAWAHPRIVAN
jgi:hypothetical protein